jgi:hypothetical protein
VLNKRTYLSAIAVFLVKQEKRSNEMPDNAYPLVEDITGRVSNHPEYSDHAKLFQITDEASGLRARTAWSKAGRWAAAAGGNIKTMMNGAPMSCGFRAA